MTQKMLLHLPIIIEINSFQNPLILACESYDMVKSIFLQVFPADTNSSVIYSGLKNDVIFYKIEENSGSENITVKFYNLNNFIF